MISQWFNIIKKTGLSSDMKDGDGRKIMVVNSFSFLTALLCTFCGVSLALMSGDYSIFFTAMGFVSGFLSILLLNRNKKYSAAKFGLMFVFCMVMLYYGVTFGESTQVHFLGLFLIGVPLLICSPAEKELKFMCLVLILTSLILLETNYYFMVIEPMEMSRDLTFMFRWLIMSIVLLLNGIVISFYQINISGLVKRLNKRNDSLKKKNELVVSKEAELVSAYTKLEDYNAKLETEVRNRTMQLRKSNMALEAMLVNLKDNNAQLRDQDQQLKGYVAELESLKQDLMQARDEAQHANAAKSAFLREISHEIRNPLNAIIGISFLLLNEQANRNKIPRSIVHLVDNIHNSSRNLLEIINNVLELARIEAGKTDELHPEPFVLREWIRSVVNIYQDASKVKGVTLQLQVDHKLPGEVVGDRLHLTQIVNNLLGNALKFTPSGKKVTLHIYLQEPAQWCLRVADEGVGIAKEKQKLIFQPYEQADESIHQNFGGTGLGLTISRRITELMGGTIEVWSEQGQGAAFTVTLPLEVEAVSLPAEQQDERREYAAFPSDKTVLLMEDSEINQMIMERFFSHLGIHLLIAGNGEEGLAMAHNCHPHLIIMDMHMPKLTGNEVIRFIREDPELQHIPVIAISADAFREQQKEALDAGVNEYLIKPVEFDRLYSVMDKYLSKEAPYPLRIIKAS
ncbi:response regulator [Chitinophaga barathri]|uniref:histidine kinase n=2 Tax=Chitinophaga barathri TaxID=1647451 RepID=A0A3N4MKG9_9BACT|nr:response regulator [Chitinophaga barathri]